MSAIINWPVFEKLREDEDFIMGFEEIFGEPLAKSLTKPPEEIDSPKADEGLESIENSYDNSFG